MKKKHLDKLITGLQQLYPENSIKVVETHISVVLLTDDFAYKVKKAVNLGFIDSSTLEKRQFLCHREVELNRRLCPDVYLGVVVVREKDGQWIWEGEEGVPVEYAVKMTRMDNQRQMNLLLERGEVTDRHLVQVADAVAVFHKHASAVIIPDPVRELRVAFADLLRIEPVMRNLFGEVAVKELRTSVDLADGFLEALSQRINDRQEAGFTIDGHGDLHTGNIFLLEKPIIFDCIDFNDVLRSVDVLNEIAFLSMDLNYYGRNDLEKTFLRAYLRINPAIRGKEDWVLLHYYKWYRANVRLKVNALTLEGYSCSDRNRLPIQEVVKKYWKLFLDLKRNLCMQFSATFNDTSGCFAYRPKSVLQVGREN